MNLFLTSPFQALMPSSLAPYALCLPFPAGMRAYILWHTRVNLSKYLCPRVTCPFYKILYANGIQWLQGYNANHLLKKTTYALKTPSVVSLPFIMVLMRNCSEAEQKRDATSTSSVLIASSTTLYCQICITQMDVSGLGDLDL